MSRVTADGGETTLFLLGHQDDEIAFAPLISRIKSRQRPVRIVYLTNGAVGRATPEVRSAESTRALASLGVTSAEISYLGNDLSVPDGLLFRRFWPGTTSSALPKRGRERPRHLFGRS